jgi:hypothetical protein
MAVNRLDRDTEPEHRRRRDSVVKAHDLMAKAVQALGSAKLLLNAGDADGASNRAYYAMFDGPQGGTSTAASMNLRSTCETPPPDRRR